MEHLLAIKKSSKVLKTQINYHKVSCRWECGKTPCSVINSHFFVDLKPQNLFCTNGLSVCDFPKLWHRWIPNEEIWKAASVPLPIIHFAPKWRSPYTIKSEGAKISRQFDMVWQNVAINSGSENLCADTLYFIPLLARSDFSQNLFYAKKD